MSYYPTLREDIERAKEILAKGKPAHDEVAYLPSEELRSAALAGGTIYGADVYAAYKLLESFVEVIETMDVKLCETAMRARRRGAELTGGGRAAKELLAAAGECVCRTAGCGHSARQHVGGICQACACEGWR